MARFGKKTTTTNIPELQEYYAAKRTESTGVAWLLAVISLLVTVVILVGLFFGGRWLYRVIKDKKTDTKKTTTSQPSNTTTASEGGTSATISGDATVTVPDTQNGISSAITGSATPAQGVSPSQNPSTNTKAIAATTNIPNTGSQGIAALFLVTTIAGAGAYQLQLRKKA